MGSEAAFEAAEPDEMPLRRIHLSGYWIDSTEVTLGMYAQCVRQEGCDAEPLTATSRPEGPDHPVTLVSWHQAQAYCRWAGRRLPTEAEWEKAARGTDGRRYPWGWIGSPVSGNQVRLNFCDASCPYEFKDPSVDDGFAFTAPVGSFPAGGSPYQALDMSGNVWEWVEDWYHPKTSAEASEADSGGAAASAVKVIRGGSWLEPTWEGLALFARASNRFWHDPQAAKPDLGFRCAYGLDGRAPRD